MIVEVRRKLGGIRRRLKISFDKTNAKYLHFLSGSESFKRFCKHLKKMVSEVDFSNVLMPCGKFCSFQKCRRLLGSYLIPFFAFAVVFLLCLQFNCHWGRNIRRDF